MKEFDRRSFLSSVTRSLATLATLPLVPAQPLFANLTTQTPTDYKPAASQAVCWLDVCAPFIVEDAARDIHTEIVLTSDTFAGARGHEDRADATDYEIYLYDAAGRSVGPDGVARRLTVPAMHTTIITARELIGETKNFWGGTKIRLRPRGREPMHASDLFSSAFVRWQTDVSFDNIHANPDPTQWQNTQRYYYSMPFPSLEDYECTLSLFNPNDGRSVGEIVLTDPAGRQLTAYRYELKPHASLLFNLNAGGLISDPSQVFREAVPSIQSGSRSSAILAVPGQPQQPAILGAPLTRGSGSLAVTNDEGAAKSFGYLLIKQPARERFSVEHPIHQGLFKPRPTVVPLDSSDQFKAKNVLFSPLIFRAKRVGAITLESRCYFGAGLPLEEALWLYPFIVDGDGKIAWSGMEDAQLAAQLSAAQAERKVIRLTAGQSCALNFAHLALPEHFSGGIGLAVSPDSTHTLMKVEVRVPEWGAHAFTHFRPGFRSARAYQKPKQRGGLATDYIASGARLVKGQSGVLHDELIGVMSIDDDEIGAAPVLELFGPRGIMTRLPLGTLPAFGCRHYLLSELLTGAVAHERLSLRLVDERATLVMSILHLDYARRDIALDHGSDRFSTFTDYTCQ